MFKPLVETTAKNLVISEVPAYKAHLWPAAKALGDLVAEVVLVGRLLPGLLLVPDEAADGVVGPAYRGTG